MPERHQVFIIGEAVNLNANACSVVENNRIEERAQIGQLTFCNKRTHGTKSAMLEGKLIIISALGH